MTDAGMLTDQERVVFRATTHGLALRFYEALRLNLREEFETGGSFYLPARALAKREFLPGRTDRKLYLTLTHELQRLRLIDQIEPAGFRRDKTRSPATYVFTTGPRPRFRSAGNVIVFAEHQRKRTLATLYISGGAMNPTFTDDFMERFPA